MREAGILLPISCLPSPYGIGTFGGAAYRFVDFLARAGQKNWQILPLGPTGFGDSPYQSFSSFGGNPYFIDLDLLVQQELLTREECLDSNLGGSSCRVDYYNQYLHRLPLLKLAAQRFAVSDLGFWAFCSTQDWWLEDYALFACIKTTCGEAPLQQWDKGLRLRCPQVLHDYRDSHHEDIVQRKVVQYLFFRQWQNLKDYANKRGVKIIGDLPIYVASDSAEVWSKPELFDLDPDLNPVCVAGCPPDAFSAQGQLWGNPLYNWEVHRAEDYCWWLRRLKFAGELYDTVRIDHFRGFESFYAIPAGDRTAVGGSWQKGPGEEFLATVKAALPSLNIIAEDLGFLTPEVHQLLTSSGFPGMKVLQFAFDGPGNSYLPHNHCRNAVVYTGTHDNPTTTDWIGTAPPDHLAFAREYLDVTGDNLTGAMIRAALGSVCDLAIIPLQDWLGLGAEARINTPSTVGSNWTWRLQPNALNDTLAADIHRLTRIYGR